MQVKLKPNSIILMSFIGVILIGALLLSLPISSSDGKGIPFIDALFTATTSACVTGLTTVSIADTFSTFGHIVILVLIQIGGLGVITVVASVAVLLNKRLVVIANTDKLAKLRE
jgi:trk system potassium uptake protein TrkH